MPEPDEIAGQFDFHQVLGAMNSYPTLLRRLGVVVDLVLSLDHFTPSGDEPLAASVIFAQGALSVTRLPDVSPETRAALSETGFFAVSDGSPGAAAARVVDGLLELDPSRLTAASRRRCRWPQDHELRPFARPPFPGRAPSRLGLTQGEARPRPLPADCRDDARAARPRPGARGPLRPQRQDE